MGKFIQLNSLKNENRIFTLTAVQIVHITNTYCDEHDEGILFSKLMIIQQTYACVEVLVLLGSGLYVRIVSPFFKGLYTFVSNASVDNVWS